MNIYREGHTHINIYIYIFTDTDTDTDSFNIARHIRYMDKYSGMSTFA